MRDEQHGSYGRERTRPAKENQCEQPQDCCAMRAKASVMIRRRIEAERQRLAGMEKLLKVAELADDDPAFEELLFQLIHNL